MLNYYALLFCSVCMEMEMEMEMEIILFVLLKIFFGRVIDE